MDEALDNASDGNWDDLTFWLGIAESPIEFRPEQAAVLADLIDGNIKRKQERKPDRLAAITTAFAEQIRTILRKAYGRMPNLVDRSAAIASYFLSGHAEGWATDSEQYELYYKVMDRIDRPKNRRY